MAQLLVRLLLLAGVLLGAATAATAATQTCSVVVELAPGRTASGRPVYINLAEMHLFDAEGARVPSIQWSLSSRWPGTTVAALSDNNAMTFVSTGANDVNPRLTAAYDCNIALGQVVIVNRADACAACKTRLATDFAIRFLDSAGADQHPVTPFAVFGTQPVWTIFPSGTCAVRISRRAAGTSGTYINLQEVVLLDGAKARVKLQAIKMSSEWPGFNASLCIDGDNRTICATGRGDTSPWLHLSHPCSAGPSEVVVHNRPGLESRITAFQLSFIDRAGRVIGSPTPFTTARQTYNIPGPIKSCVITNSSTVHTVVDLTARFAAPFGQPKGMAFYDAAESQLVLADTTDDGSAGRYVKVDLSTGNVNTIQTMVAGMKSPALLVDRSTGAIYVPHPTSAADPTLQAVARFTLSDPTLRVVAGGGANYQPESGSNALLAELGEIKAMAWIEEGKSMLVSYVSPQGPRQVIRLNLTTSPATLHVAWGPEAGEIRALATLGNGSSTFFAAEHDSQNIVKVEPGGVLTYPFDNTDPTRTIDVNSLAMDKAGRLWVADAIENKRILALDGAGNPVLTLGQIGTPGGDGDGWTIGSGVPKVTFVQALLITSKGDLIFSDHSPDYGSGSYFRIRKAACIQE